MRVVSDRIFGKIDMKKKIIKFILVLMWFQSVCSLYAADRLNIEQVSFSIPKTIYFTEEKIWVKGSVKTEFGVEISKVFYAELLDQAHKSWVLGKFPIAGGQVFNYLELPSSLPSGNYMLRVFTRTSAILDLDNGIVQQLVTILNPKLPPVLGNVAREIPSDDISTAIIPMIVEKDIYDPSSSVEMFVNEQLKDQIQRIKLSLVNPYLIGFSSQIRSADVYESIDEMPILPELFGHIIHARLLSSAVDTTKTYFLSAHGTQSALYTDRPDELGNLFFDLGGFRHWDHVLIQVEDGSDLNSFEIQSPSPKTKFLSNFKIPELRILQEDADFLQRLRLSSSLEPYFTHVYQRDSMEVVVGFVADQTYILDDYTRFEKVETVVKEYIPNVFVRRKDKLKEFRLINVEGGYLFEGNPLMMVDALPIFNSDVLANFNPKFFRKVEVLNREFYLNDRKYDGALNFYSFQNDFGLFPIPDEVLFQRYAGLNPHVSFPKPIYAALPSEKSMPDFRSVLFWYERGVDHIQPSLEVNTSQMVGEYLLEVEFIDQSGKLKTWKKEILVR